MSTASAAYLRAATLRLASARRMRELINAEPARRDTPLARERVSQAVADARKLNHFSIQARRDGLA